MKTPHRQQGDLPIAIIGAGPVGLAMAAHLGEWLSVQSIVGGIVILFGLPWP